MILTKETFVCFSFTCQTAVNKRAFFASEWEKRCDCCLDVGSYVWPMWQSMNEKKEDGVVQGNSLKKKKKKK